MSAEHQVMDLRSAVHHVADKTIELTFESREQPATIPNGILPDQWIGDGGEKLAVLVPVNKRFDVTAPTGKGVIGLEPNGTQIWVRFTWNGTTWVQGPRLNPADWSVMT